MDKENFSKHDKEEDPEKFKEKVKNADSVEFLCGLHKVWLFELWL